ncbi:hypothetical protein LL037_11370 [Clostridium estertheticum]|uniref:hypothetical protein n=1 Tax=Clostridium estertheticum TaxID=238834 RepID=UPI001C0B3CDE|nr:hypothetical protein [Clostridium estertheticum]MBU3202263.1 hypothetical protein [Clostridium estertheticum]WAG67693.1 hypothetical protein LL037_11370 [Clostridium estertheticum]
MKIKKNLSILVLALIITLSGMMGTFVYAYKYTASHATNSSSPQGGNGKMPQGNFGKKGGTRPQGDFKNKNGTKPNGNPPSGDSQKSVN